MDNEQITTNNHLQQSTQESNEDFKGDMISDEAADTMAEPCLRPNNALQITKGPWNPPTSSTTPSNRQQGRAIYRPLSHELPVPATGRLISPHLQGHNPFLYPATGRRLSLHLKGNKTLL